MSLLKLKYILLTLSAMIVPAVATSQEPQRDSLSMEFDIDEVSVAVSPPPLVNVVGEEFTLKFDRLDQLPQFMGSSDALRTMQLLPGVQTTGDIASGLYVQGCEPAHSLFLLDGAPIYSPVHLLGFLPSFNSSHLSEVTLHKGYISPLYSSRLASVVSVTSRRDRPSKIELEGEMTLLAASLTLNAPTGDESSLLVSARSSYINPILQAVESVTRLDQGLGYTMQDVNLTWNKRFSERDHLTLSGYYGLDKTAIDYADLTLKGAVEWRNSAVSAVWEHRFSDRIAFVLNGYNTTYDDYIRVEQPFADMRLRSSICDSGLSFVQSNALSEKLKLNCGLSATNRLIDPQSIAISGFVESYDNDREVRVNNLEYALFAEGEYAPFEWLTIDGAIKYGGVATQGGAFEPRLGVSLSRSDNTTFSAVYTRQYQYVNQVLVSSSGLPLNYFVGTTPDSPAQMSDNLSLSVNYKTPNHNYGFGLTLYGRRLQNQYINTSMMTSMITNKGTIYDRFAIGEGLNFGSELICRYNFGAVKGWLSYTLGYAVRQMEGINNGEPFYSSNDRRHDLSLVALCSLGGRWSLSSTFVFASGIPFSATNGIYTVGEQMLVYKSKYNEARMPSYQRLDLSASYRLNIKWFKQSKLNISLYNAYGYANPLMCSSHIFSDRESGEFGMRVKNNSLFTILPSVGLSFKL